MNPDKASRGSLIIIHVVRFFLQIRIDRLENYPFYKLCNTKMESNNSLYIDVISYAIVAEAIFISLRSDHSEEKQGFHAAYEIYSTNQSGECCMR